MGLFDDAKAALLQAMRDELERRTLEEAARIFSTERTGPAPDFSERDFGRWSDKVSGSPSRSDSSSFKESGKERIDVFQYPAEKCSPRAGLGPPSSCPGAIWP